MNQLALINEVKVITVRGVKVMLDRDVAESLGVTTSQLNENASRSPNWKRLRDRGIEHDYRFQLTSEEVENLRSQFAIFSEFKYLPWVYSENGCLLFGTSLNSEAAFELALALVRTFKTVKDIIKGSSKISNALKEAKEVYKTCKFFAGEFGLRGNQKVLAAVKATKKEVGVDVYALLDRPNMESDSKQDRYLSPTELGKTLGSTARTINKLLCEKGLQFKTGKVWSMTAEGKKYGVLMDVGKKHSDGTPIQQLKWKETVATEIKHV